MNKQLPKNWVETDLFTLANVSTGKKDANHAEEDGEYVFYTCALGQTKSPTYSFEGPSIIVPGNGNIGYVFYFEGKFEAYQRTYVINNIRINPKYLFYHFKCYWKSRTIDNLFGSTIQYVKIGNFKSYNIDFPPVTEQLRIVTKLDALFAKLENIKTSITSIPKLLKDLRRQVLTQAVTGKLTEGWRKEKNMQWEEFLLNDVCSSITDGDHQAPPQVKEGIPFLVISNVSKGYFEFNNVSRFVSKEYYNSLKETRKPKNGDVLYTVTGSYGIPILVNFEKEFCFQRHIAILRPDSNKVLSEFLKYLLQSNLILNQANNVATGTAQLTVPLGGIKKFEINLPQLNEQQEIVSRVESLFTKADALEKQYEILKIKIDSLPQAILNKAFKGELCEQLESDGDAKELLKQITELKVATTGKKKVTRYAEGEIKLSMVAEPK